MTDTLKGKTVWTTAMIVNIMAVITSIGILIYILASHKPCEEGYIEIKEEVPIFYTMAPEEGLRDALEYYNVDYPDIVYAQAVLETGSFKSRVCREYNNLFGLYNSRKGDYYRFNHWIESVVAYREMIQGGHRYEEHYYDYLKKIGYAEDKDYISKVKKITNETRDQGRHSTRDTVP